MRTIIDILIAWVKLPIYLFNMVLVLTQLYGELNRIRLIHGEKGKRGKEIETFDREHNKYFPYFGSEKSEKKYTSMKGKY